MRGGQERQTANVRMSDKCVTCVIDFNAVTDLALVAGLEASTRDGGKIFPWGEVEGLFEEKQE